MYQRLCHTGQLANETSENSCADYLMSDHRLPNTDAGQVITGNHW